MKYRKILITSFVLLLALVLVACKKTENKAPVLSGVANTSTPFGVEFDVRAGVTAFDEEDGELTSEIKVEGTVDHNVPERYTLNYSVEDSGGLVTTAVRVVTVLDEVETTLANGWFDYKFATPETRHTFFAAAEGWLLENAYAGIPLAAQTGLTLQSERIVLPVDDYIPTFGWGTNYATITQNDKQVSDANGGKFDLLSTTANEGEFTYRTWMQQEPETLNYYVGQSNTESTYGSYINGSFYTMALNSTANGWEFVPELASGEPVPTNPTVINGKTTARIWTIPLRDNLKWAYNVGTDTSSFPTGHEVLDANDFIYSYRLALDNEWFRATSGGGDFVSQKIKGAEAYYEAVSKGSTLAQLDALWAEFGIKASPDGKSLTVEFTEAKSTFDIQYSFGMPAVNQAVYEANPALYGTAPEHIASSGLYTITYWESGVGSRYKKVDTHPRANAVSWTNETISILTGSSAQDQAFEAFQNGLLDSVGIPNSRVDEFGNDPNVLRTPGASIWSLNVNMTGSVQAQQAQWPGSTYIPEPILGNKDFRLALYFALNRNDLTTYDSKTYPTGMKISNAYYVDPEGGIPYRLTPQGMAVGENLSYSTNGYDAEAAQALFKRAVAEEIAAGNYEKGTAENWTVIELEVLTFDEASGSAVSDPWMAFAKEYFDRLIDDENFVKVEMKKVNTPGSKIYDMIAAGDYDLALSSISGNTLDAASFLDIFITDNRSGFLLNYGYDSSVPEIEVEWEEDGVEHKHIFSFDAIYELLNGRVYLKDGNKISEFATVDQLVQIDLETLDLTEVSRDVDTGLKLANIFHEADLDKVDELLGLLITAKDEDDQTATYLYIVTRTGNIFEINKVMKDVSFETTEEDVLDNATEDFDYTTKTDVTADDLAELAEWFEYDLSFYDDVKGFYLDGTNSRLLVVVGEAEGLFFLVGSEEILVENLANATLKLAEVTKGDVFNVTDSTEDADMLAYLEENYGATTIDEMAAMFSVDGKFLKVYEFDVDADGTQGDKPYVALFVVAGNIVDFYWL